MKIILSGVVTVLWMTTGCHTRSQLANRIQTATVSFSAPLRLPVGTQPATVMIDHAKKNEKPALVVANSGSDNISVYLFDADERFVQPAGSPFSAGQNPNDIALGDFNGDGQIDVAVANHGVQFVTVLLGNAKREFKLAPRSPFAVPSNPHPHGIATADFNGDNKLDLVIDSWAENKVVMMLGNGDGTFQTPGVKLDVGRRPYERVRAADLNGDHNADMITSNFGNESVSILFGDGNGAFSRRDYSVPPDPFGVAADDFNGDHHLDIAVVHYSGQGTDPTKNGLSILYGDGKGEFVQAAGSPFRTGHYPPTIATGDLNGDGIADIAIPNTMENSVTIYLAGSSGVKQDGAPIPVGRSPQGIAIGDLNGDGKADLVVANQGGNDVWVLLRK